MKARRGRFQDMLSWDGYRVQCDKCGVYFNGYRLLKAHKQAVHVY